MAEAAGEAEEEEVQVKMIFTLLFLAAVVAITAFSAFNNLITLRNRVDNQWSQIDIQLKRRSDLIPKLETFVKVYAAHEKHTFEDVAKARSQMTKAKTVQQKAKAYDMLKHGVRDLYAIAEDYPDLKANENFMSLQRQITETENKIAYTRQFYNDIVERYESKRLTFPSNLIVKAFGFGKKEYFDAN